MSKISFSENFAAQAALGPIEIKRTLSTSPKRIFTKSGVQFGQDPNLDWFKKLHIAITRDLFTDLAEQGLYRPFNNGFSLREVTGSPDTLADIFLKDLKRVGEAYGWDAREKYQPEHRAELEANMADPETKLFHFHEHDEHIGVVKFSGIKRDWKRNRWEQGIDKFKAVNIYSEGEPTLSEFPNPIEFDKVGIFPGFEGGGRGKVMLAQMLRVAMLEMGFNMVYLDSRWNNPKGIEEFYLSMGLRSFCVETNRTDLTRKIEWPPERGLAIKGEYRSGSGGGHSAKPQNIQLAWDAEDVTSDSTNNLGWGRPNLDRFA